MNPREHDFVAARRRIEAKARSAGDKLTTLEDAGLRVKDGDHVAVGGCLFSRTPMALVRELLRQRRRGLTLSRNLTCTEGEFLMAAGAVDRIVTAWMSIGLPWGVSKILRHYVESGQVALEEWSHLALGLRFRAGAMGVPFLPALTMLGSDLMAVSGTKTIQDPYTGETLAAIPALFPDVALLHVHRAPTRCHSPDRRSSIPTRPSKGVRPVQVTTAVSPLRRAAATRTCWANAPICSIQPCAPAPRPEKPSGSTCSAPREGAPVTGPASGWRASSRAGCGLWSGSWRPRGCRAGWC